MQFYIIKEEQQKIKKHYDYDSCPHYIDLWDEYCFHGNGRSLLDGKMKEIELEMIQWCKENTVGKMYADGEMEFGFELHEDFVMFKLVWSKGEE